MRAARKRGMTHHSDRGAQSVSLRTTQPLKEAGIAPSVQSTGDAYANALAEAINGLDQAAGIHRRAWPSLTQVCVGNSELGALGQPSACAGDDRGAIPRPSRLRFRCAEAGQSR